MIGQDRIEKHRLWLNGDSDGERLVCHLENLQGADLREVKVDYQTTGYFSAISEGEIVVWKKLDSRIVKMLVPSHAARSSATTRKCRVSEAVVLEISTGENAVVNLACGHTTVYRVGESVFPDSWDSDRWNECSHGIHCFLTKEEAEAW